MNLIHGDCLEEMRKLEPGSVDMVLTDPPYGTTACKWDSVIPFDPMWECVGNLVKPNGAICLFGSEPFSSALRMSNIKQFKYDWVWKKNSGAGFVHAKNRPLKKHELVSVFSSAPMGHFSLLGDKRLKYFPQDLVVLNTISKNGISGKTIGRRPSNRDGFLSTHTNYPGTVLDFKSDSKKIHPTQKPVALLEYLIKTYTLPGETVLDFTMGSGSTGIACANTGRKFIGIEKDPKYFEIAKNRISAAVPAA